MRLTDAIHLHLDGLDRRDDPMFTHRSIGNSVSCGLWVRGFRSSDSYRCLIPSSISSRGIMYAANRDRYGEQIPPRLAHEANIITDRNDKSQEGAGPNYDGEISISKIGRASCRERV